MANRPIGYRLDENGNPVPVLDLAELGDIPNRVVAKDTIEPGSLFPDDEPILVSTVFLGFDHAMESGPPVLWETMIFNWRAYDEVQTRYTSNLAALAGHARWVRAIKVLEGHLGELGQRAAKAALELDRQSVGEGWPSDEAWLAVNEIAMRCAGLDPAEKDERK